MVASKRLREHLARGAIGLGTDVLLVDWPRSPLRHTLARPALPRAGGAEASAGLERFGSTWACPPAGSLARAAPSAASSWKGPHPSMREIAG